MNDIRGLTIARLLHLATTTSVRHQLKIISQPLISAAFAATNNF